MGKEKELARECDSYLEFLQQVGAEQLDAEVVIFRLLGEDGVEK